MQAKVESLVGMGFSEEHAELALKLAAHDLQRAADWLLEGGAEASPPQREGGAGSSGAGSSSSSAADEPAAATFAVGETVEASDGCGLWHAAEVVGSEPQSVRLHYVGWAAEWDEWASAASPRLRRPVGTAANGPASLRCVPGEVPPKRVRASAIARLQATANAPGAAEGAGESAGGASRSRWFARSRQTAGAAAKRRATSPAEKALADVLCPSPEADFFCADVGLTRMVQRCADEPPQPDGSSASELQPGQRCRLAPSTGEFSGAVGVVLAGATDGRGVVLQLLDGHAPHAMLCARSDLEAPETKLAEAVPSLAGRQLRTLFRANCVLNRAAAIMHARQAVLLLLCEVGWLHAAHADHESDFTLGELNGLLPDIQLLLKLAASAPVSEASLDNLNMVWAAASNLVPPCVVLESTSGSDT